MLLCQELVGAELARGVLANLLQGTGGTLAGVGCYLKKMNPAVRIVLADPEGSGLFNKV